VKKAFICEGEGLYIRVKIKESNDGEFKGWLKQDSDNILFGPKLRDELIMALQEIKFPGEEEEAADGEE